jgi:hypothetical protein
MGREMGRARLASRRVGYAERAEQYRGGDITRWLRAEEQRHRQMEVERAGDAEEERLEPRWVLEFDAKSHGGEAMTRMEECWLLCRRMLQVGLSVSHYARKRGSVLVITVGANTHALRTEAARIKLPMRMQDTMGMIPFTEQPVKSALIALILETLKHHGVDEAKIRAAEADCAALGTAELAQKAREVGCERIEVLSLSLSLSHTHTHTHTHAHWRAPAIILSRARLSWSRAGRVSLSPKRTSTTGLSDCCAVS